MTEHLPFVVPTRIETSRLRLRHFRHEDWRDLHEHYSDAECTKFTFGRALSKGESWRAMASMAGHWLLHGYGPYAIEEKESGSVLGMAGLWYPNDWPEPEIKWGLIRRSWSKGFASEAVRAIQAMALEHLPDVALISLIDRANDRSTRLAVAVGAIRERDIEFRGGVWQVYRHPRRNGNKSR